MIADPAGSPPTLNPSPNALLASIVHAMSSLDASASSWVEDHLALLVIANT
jgi:hypothetical protein